MTSQSSIRKFFSHNSFAVVGVSRSEKKFGNSVYRMMRSRGGKIYAVNPRASTVEGDTCYHSLNDLPEKVEGIVVIVPPPQAERVVRQAATAGIRHVWLQQGSESKKAIQFCEQYGMDVVHGQCIFMFAEPVSSLHKVHRYMKKITGRLPK